MTFTDLPTPADHLILLMIPKGGFTVNELNFIFPQTISKLDILVSEYSVEFGVPVAYVEGVVFEVADIASMEAIERVLVLFEEREFRQSLIVKTSDRIRDAFDSR